jgi:lysozyme
MNALLPYARPRLSREDALARLKQAGITPAQNEVIVLALRAYYQDASSENQRGIYDDAMVIIGPDHYSTYNANVDPSVFRPHVAKLKPGVYEYAVGIHGLAKPPSKRYQAYVQAGPVTVIRDGEGAETGEFGINIHRGGESGTSSLGCQTIPPVQWPAFNEALKDQLARKGQKTFRYVLI